MKKQMSLNSRKSYLQRLVLALALICSAALLLTSGATKTWADENEPPVCANHDPGPDNPCPCNPPGNPPADGGAGGGSGPASGSGPEQDGPKMSGIADPISPQRNSIFKDITDLDIPVKHGLSLKVRRTYGSNGMASETRDGKTGLGYSNNNNWHMYLYEARVKFDCTHCCFIDEMGNFRHFVYSGTTNNTHTDLHSPTDATWGAQWASLYYPYGDPRTIAPNVNRQDDKNLELYILHSQQPDDDTRFTDVTGFVVREINGPQYIFDANGFLIYYDVNWKNNVKYGTTGHVDDYLEITWIDAYCLAIGDYIKTIDLVKAPPTDGRYLQFNHPVDGQYGTLSHITSVSMYAGTTYSNLVRYGYRASGTHQGKLWRVQVGSGSNVGVQYDYGIVTVSNKQPVLNESGYFAGHYADIALISQFTDNGGGSYTVTPMVCNWVISDLWLLQANLDPKGTGKWFITVGTKKYGTYYDVIVDYQSRELDENINNSTFPRSEVYSSFSRDVERNQTYNMAVVPPLTKLAYHTASSVRATRLISGAQIRVSASPETWSPLSETRYANIDSGLRKITAQIKYNGTTPVTTYFKYEDSNNSDLPTQIVTSERGVTEYEYNTNGQTTTQRKKQWNSDANTTDTLGTITYSYITSGDNTGLLSSVTTTPAVGPQKTTTYTYYSSTDYSSGYLKGQVQTITADGESVTYTYNRFGQVKTFTNRYGTTTYIYSDETGTITYPPRLVQEQDPNSAQTSYAYNAWGGLYTVTNPGNQVTTYGYDSQNNVASVAVTGAGTTTFEHNAYGHQTLLKDAQGNGTAYTYDSLGNLATEKAYGTDTGSAGYQDDTPLYTITYAYSGATGCTSCGGLNQLTQRTITNGAGTITENLYFAYDNLGRMIGKGTTSSANDITYTYSGLLLAEINHGNSLWGNQKIQREYDNMKRLSREIYPSGRSVDYSYDAAGRLTRVKDPFGYVNNITYNTDGLLYQLKHSTLGTAQLQYDSVKRLSQLTLGNNAYTAYTYDSYGRLNSFDIKESDNDRILQHSWSYDSLGRKSATAGITVSSPSFGYNKIDFAYDADSRVTDETFRVSGGSLAWDVSYGYDNVGNRTTMSDGTYDVTSYYGAQNRETEVYVNPDNIAQTYDFKGNVTMRIPYDLSYEYYYTWDVYDRLRQVTRYNQTTVSYDYDAPGRLLRKTKGNEVTVNYWLGLNKIAEERWGSETGKSLAIFRPDYSEYGSNPETSGWTAGYTGGTLSYVNDADRGKVLRMQNGGFMIGDDWSDSLNDNDASFNDSSRKHLGLWIKNADASQTPFNIQIYAATAHYSNILIQLVSTSGTDGNYTKFLGTGYNDGAWHYLELDLNALVGQMETGDTLSTIYGLNFACWINDLYVDDIIISGGVLERSYALWPGSTIKGYLGAQAGSGGANGISAWGKYYYHLSDLGTVMSTTNASGSLIGIYEPDFFGNSRYDNGTRPDAMCITGKFHDVDADLDYFGARWYDSERGRWLSRDPLEGAQIIEGPNLYTYVQNNSITKIDPDGRFGWVPFCCSVYVAIAAYDLYNEIQDQTCAGKTGTELAACVLNKAIGNDLLSCLAAAAGSDDAMQKAADCFKCAGLDALKDIAKNAAMGCCFGGLLKGYLKGKLPKLPPLRAPLPA